MLNNKCLLIVEPTPIFHQWLTATIKVAEQALQPSRKLEISLEQMQADANCYIIPNLPAKETAAYIKLYNEEIFCNELNTWCKVKDVWPALSFNNFISYLKFTFYFDWMDFQGEKLTAERDSILLLVKPKEEFTNYLRNLLIERFNVIPQEANEKLNTTLVQKGSTAIITDINKLEEVDYFVNQHCTDIFTHQLILWGGEETQDLWPRDLNKRGFEECFSIEIHQHTYLMPH